MSCYNFMKRADRQRLRQDREAEIQAVRDGLWPRDIDDRMRWNCKDTNPYFSAAENRRIMAEYAARMCQREVDYLDDLERRLAADDPDLVGWER
jgi:hypothetical protein